MVLCIVFIITSSAAVVRGGQRAQAKRPSFCILLRIFRLLCFV